jgi:hypothetical protein
VPARIWWRNFCSTSASRSGSSSTKRIVAVMQLAELAAGYVDAQLLV